MEEQYILLCIPTYVLRYLPYNDQNLAFVFVCDTHQNFCVRARRKDQISLHNKQGRQLSPRENLEVTFFQEISPYRSHNFWLN